MHSSKLSTVDESYAALKALGWRQWPARSVNAGSCNVAAAAGMKAYLLVEVFSICVADG